MLDEEAGQGKPQVAVGVAWSLGASPVRGGDESGGGDKRVFGAGGGGGGWLGSQGVCDYERCWCTGRDSDISSAWSLGHAGPETEGSLVSDLSRSVGVEDLGFGVCE